MAEATGSKDFVFSPWPGSVFHIPTTVIYDHPVVLALVVLFFVCYYLLPPRRTDAAQLPVGQATAAQIQPGQAPAAQAQQGQAPPAPAQPDQNLVQPPAEILPAQAAPRNVMRTVTDFFRRQGGRRIVLSAIVVVLVARLIQTQFSSGGIKPKEDINQLEPLIGIVEELVQTQLPSTTGEPPLQQDASCRSSADQVGTPRDCSGAQDSVVQTEAPIATPQDKPTQAQSSIQQEGGSQPPGGASQDAGSPQDSGFGTQPPQDGKTLSEPTKATQESSQLSSASPLDGMEAQSSQDGQPLVSEHLSAMPSQENLPLRDEGTIPNAETPQNNVEESQPAQDSKEAQSSEDVNKSPQPGTIEANSLPIQ